MFLNVALKVLFLSWRNIKFIFVIHIRPTVNSDIGDTTVDELLLLRTADQEKILSCA